MKNNKKIKKLIIFILIYITIAMSIFIFLNNYEYHMYTQNFNKKIEQITLKIKNEYPKISEDDIIKILNSQDNTKLFSKYGIDTKEDSLILENNDIHQRFLIIDLVYLGIITLIFFLPFFIFYQKRNKEIKEITNYLKQLNQKNYSLEISKIDENELSILRQEIYKTTVMLKEIAENSVQDKRNLKKYLEDISHQIKTPLTSLLIILDNLMEKEEMDETTYEEFIKEAKREVTNINRLIQSLLTLSSFDVNAIKFKPKVILVNKLINDVCQNVLPICDLKNVKLTIKGDKKIKLKCDDLWQNQALTNILKNSVEHSLKNNDVKITFQDNNVYVMITIENVGKTISKKDIKHIFDRFYKGENAKPDSIGIGLCLAKTIINNDNGTISVISKNNKTKFIIKYYKF